MEDNEREGPAKLGQAKIIDERPKAIEVKFDDGRRLWVPKSCIHDDSEVWHGEDQEGQLIVFQWWADEKGLG